MIAGYTQLRREGCLAAAVRADHWLAEPQDADGCWRKFEHNDTPHVHNTRGTRALLATGLIAGEVRLVQSAKRNLDWALSQQSSCGWFAGNAFVPWRSTFTHIFRKTWRWLRDRRRYIGNGEAQFFFGDEPARLNHPELVKQFPHINHPSVVELARVLKPDVIAVFGTSLIRGELLKEGRIGIANLHGGLSPEYRGADCTFWALYNGEPEKVGCTLHWIDAGIDTGGLIAHVSPKVQPDDNELKLFWRSVQTSAGVYAEFIRRLAAGENFGQIQRDKGRLYQVKQRSLRHEQVVDQRLQQGILQGLNLDVRIAWYTSKEIVAGR